eukprot:819506-Pyramimonas_sp.AAC.1
MLPAHRRTMRLATLGARESTGAMLQPARQGATPKLGDLGATRKPQREPSGDLHPRCRGATDTRVMQSACSA